MYVQLLLFALLIVLRRELCQKFIRKENEEIRACECCRQFLLQNTLGNVIARSVCVYVCKHVIVRIVCVNKLLLSLRSRGLSRAAF